MYITRYVRGGIYYADLGEAIGNEQAKTRPVVIVSNELNNTHANTVTTVPITSAVKTALPVHVTIPCVQNSYNGEDTNIVLCEQIRTISKERIKNFLGILDADTMYKIEKAMRIQLGMEAAPTKATQTPPKHRFITYSDEYKHQFMKDAAKCKTLKELADKYSISIKTASARKQNWINFK